MTKSAPTRAVMTRTKLYLRFFAVFSIITIVVFSVITSNIISFDRYDRHRFNGVFISQRIYHIEDSTPRLLETMPQATEKEEYKMLNIKTESQNITLFIKLIISSNLNNVDPTKNNMSTPIILKILGGPNDVNDTTPPVIIEVLIDKNSTNISTSRKDGSIVKVPNIQENDTKQLDKPKEILPIFIEQVNDSLSILDNKFSSPIPGDDHIIFIESSCVVNTSTSNIFNASPSIIHLQPRQACAIEAAARTNPGATIYLFQTCPVDDYSLFRSSELVQRVFQYSNVRVWHENMSSFFEGTPLEEFYKSGLLENTTYPLEHASDVLRILALWKYGGTYLDIDFIVRRSLAGLGKNFACAETDYYVANGVLSLSSNGVGKTIVDACVNELNRNFRGDIFNHNGPALITRILQKQCNTTNTTHMTSETCDGFTVLPTTSFFPVLYNYPLFFDEVNSDAVMATMKDSYAVHLWGHIIQGKTLTGSEQPLVRLEKEFCPISFALTPDQSEY